MAESAMLLRVICGLILLCILVAGLWPFHAPRNEVKWLGNGDGLLFGRYGSIVSSGALNVGSHGLDDACSLEIWLQPRRVRSSGTILAFYRMESGFTPFALRQSLGDLVLQHATQDQSHPAHKGKVYVDDILSHQKPVLITISSGRSGTTIFADGAFVQKASNFQLSTQDVTGRLVIGNSPVTTDDWSGHLKGLALYDRELTADDVSRHFANWTNEESDLIKTRDVVALYFFNERAGNVVRNQADSAINLLIPERFFVLHAQFLERPWDEFRPDWNYWKDVGINIGGFIPLGFFFCAYFSLLRRVEHPAAFTIALGFAISLTIEVLQAFLPTRDSGMTDLITNTLGTAIGVMAFTCRPTQAVMAAIGCRIERSRGL